MVGRIILFIGTGIMYDKPIIAVKPKKKYIHVNMHKIRANKKHGTNEVLICVMVIGTIILTILNDDE